LIAVAMMLAAIVGGGTPPSYATATTAAPVPDLAPMVAKQVDGVRQWLASPQHRRNLLAWQWRSMGIAVINAEGVRGVFGGGLVEIAAAEFGVRS